LSVNPYTEKLAKYMIWVYIESMGGAIPCAEVHSMVADHRVNLSIPWDVHLAIKKIAAYHRRSFQEEAVRIMDKHARKFGFNFTYEYKDAKQRKKKLRYSPEDGLREEEA
jgi:hypothetical protein